MKSVDYEGEIVSHFRYAWVVWPVVGNVVAGLASTVSRPVTPRVEYVRMFNFSWQYLIRNNADNCGSVT